MRLKSVNAIPTQRKEQTIMPKVYACNIDYDCNAGNCYVIKCTDTIHNEMKECWNQLTYQM